MHKVERTREVVRSGISMGSALAIAISWSTHQSILWAIIHGVFSWLYVIYFRPNEELSLGSELRGLSAEASRDPTS